MDITQARQLMASIPLDRHAVLTVAHDRYMYFTGVYTDTNPDFSAGQIA